MGASQRTVRETITEKDHPIEVEVGDVLVRISALPNGYVRVSIEKGFPILSPLTTGLGKLRVQQMHSNELQHLVICKVVGKKVVK